MRNAWEPAASTRHLVIEMAGTGGTCLGKFTRRKDAARLHRAHVDSDEWEVWSLIGLGQTGIVRPGSKGWAGYSMYEPTGETALEYSGPDFMAAVSAVLGKPGYGYSWYRVKRDAA
jgi:hypothetical protein